MEINERQEEEIRLICRNEFSKDRNFEEIKEKIVDDLCKMLKSSR